MLILALLAAAGALIATRIDIAVILERLKTIENQIARIEKRIEEPKGK